MGKILETVGPWGPVLFGFGFLAPLIAQIIERADVAMPFGLTPLMLGLIMGPALGLAAKLRGRWI
ncbi:MAG: hypothetical protein GC184_08760 [Rhizobiales bacterium]|nr:hypothetical protein [Hyphomicrobiales bacterium]